MFENLKNRFQQLFSKQQIKPETNKSNNAQAAEIVGGEAQKKKVMLNIDDNFVTIELTTNHMLVFDNNENLYRNLRETMLRFVREEKLVEANEIFFVTKEITLTVFGDQHPEWAALVAAEGELRYLLLNNIKAENLYKKAIQLFRNANSRTHPEYCRSLCFLGQIYTEAKNIPAAEEICREAVEVGKVVLGENNPNQASNLNNLAVVYYLKGDYEEAEELYCQSLEIIRKTLGVDHPNYVATMESLYKLYKDTGNDHAANSLIGNLRYSA